MLHNRLARDLLLLFGGSVLPIDIDFSTLADGALPVSLLGSTWTISGGYAVNSPTLGIETLTDGGLEANYTSGLCDTLTIGAGTPTVAQSADVHGGSKAQEITGAANNNTIRFANEAAMLNQWYLYSYWGKRTAGTTQTGRAGINLTSVLPVTPFRRVIESAAYAQIYQLFRSPGTTTLTKYAGYIVGASGFDTFVVDDFSLKAVTQSTLWALASTGNPNTYTRIAVNAVNSSCGVIARANSQSNPTSFLLATIARHDDKYSVYLEKCVAGTWTTLITATNVAFDFNFSADEILELRCSGTTVQVFYAGAQIGTDQTVSDSEIVNNTCHGMMAAGASAITSFFCGSSLSAYMTGYAGSSVTSPATGYAYLTQNWLNAHYPAVDFSVTNAAIAGHAPWSSLVRLERDIQPYDVQFMAFDDKHSASDPVEDHHLFSFEAFIRRMWTIRPTALLFWMKFFGVVDYTTDDLTVSAAQTAWWAAVEPIVSNYGVQKVDIYTRILDYVNNEGGHLSDIFADNVHPNDAGQAQVATLLETYMAPYAALFGNAVTLASRVNACSDYEQAPTIKNGTDYDSRVGSWVDTGTSVYSNTAGDTITYSATCVSYGAYRADAGTNSIDVNIDGSGWVLDQSFYQNGRPTGLARAARTIQVRVRAGGECKVDEFWAI